MGGLTPPVIQSLPSFVGHRSWRRNYPYQVSSQPVQIYTAEGKNPISCAEMAILSLRILNAKARDNR